MSKNQENQLLGTTEKVTKATYVSAIGHIVITSICDLYMSQYCVTSSISRLPAPVSQESEFLEKNEVGQVQDMCWPLTIRDGISLFHSEGFPKGITSVGQPKDDKGPP